MRCIFSGQIKDRIIILLKKKCYRRVPMFEKWHLTLCVTSINILGHLFFVTTVLILRAKCSLIEDEYKNRRTPKNFTERERAFSPQRNVFAVPKTHRGPDALNSSSRPKAITIYYNLPKYRIRLIILFPMILSYRVRVGASRIYIDDSRIGGAGVARRLIYGMLSTYCF